jgi:hypothetical protein
MKIIDPAGNLTALFSFNAVLLATSGRASRWRVSKSIHKSRSIDGNAA